MNIASITIEFKTNRLRSVPEYQDPLYFVGVLQKKCLSRSAESYCICDLDELIFL